MEPISKRESILHKIELLIISHAICRYTCLEFSSNPKGARSLELEISTRHCLFAPPP